ncbi:gamma-aminobutyric acid receptor subunit alpha-6-like isoform X2 [Clytia hemisphaerica]|uniref:gamma-aminobutyric acid receptor subunit alpha-6-like isoform X2 n=1 Tax=Clytia hemisphaerica TaxID=252671 RepID=UPI0034D6E8BE
MGLRISMLILTLLLYIEVSIATGGSSHNKTKIFRQLLQKGYNKHVLPSEHGEPVKVEVNMVIHDFVPRSPLSANSYSMDFLYRSRWKDHRLAFKHLLEPGDDFVLEFGIQSVVDKIWVPGISFDNQIMNIETKVPQANIRMQFFSDGGIRLSQRHQVELACKMDTGDFPFDRQFCDMRMLSYAYDKDHVDLQWEKSNSTHFQTVFGPQNTNMIRMRMKSYSLKSTVRTSMLGKANTVHAESPPNGKSTLVNWYVLVSFIFVFLGIVEFAIVGITDKIWKQRIQRTIKESSNVSQHRKNNHGLSPRSRRQSAYSQTPCESDHVDDLNVIFKRQLQQTDSTARVNDLQPQMNRRNPRSNGMFLAPTGVALQELTKVHEYTQKWKAKAGLKEKVHARLYEKQKFGKDDAHVLDQLARVIFPVCFVLFNIIYGVAVYFHRQKDNLASEGFIAPKRLQWQDQN